jgi:hypothetical protein
MNHIKCTKCNEELPAKAFPLVRCDGPDRRSVCRRCCAASFRNWRGWQGDDYLARKRAYWHRKGKQLRERRREAENETSKSD